MPALIRIVFFVLAFSAFSYAGGITGVVSDSKGKAKAGVTISVKVGGQQITVKTDANGVYVVTVPNSSYGSSAKVHANGSYITSCTIPRNGAYARVNVNYK